VGGDFNVRAGVKAILTATDGRRGDTEG